MNPQPSEHSLNEPKPITPASVELPKPVEAEEIDDGFGGSLFTVEQSPGFKLLDAMLSRKDISSEKYTNIFLNNRCNILKQKFKAIYEFRSAAADEEKSTNRKIKALQQDIANQKIEMDKTASKAYEINSEVGELKREQLRV